MGFFQSIRSIFTRSARVTGSAPIVRDKPLHEQYQRLGGNITPQAVSWIMQQADMGQPAALVDLFLESRQKDPHLQSVCGTREGAVALCDLEFVTPESAKRGDKKAEKLCRRAVDEFDNWPTLIECLSSSFIFGHATCEVKWHKTKDGLILPYRAEPIPERDFVFAQANGALRYTPRVGSSVEVDLLAENPGRIVQITRRIVGGPLSREGLARCLIWQALLRNWDLRDWVALGEVGWKPWRLGKYKPGTPQEDIDALTDALLLIGSTGVGVFPDNSELAVEWPKNNQSSSTGTHRELFDALGREMSKAVLGQTTSVESGPNGDRASTQTRDNIRLDIREREAVAVSAVLRAQLFRYVVELNIGEPAIVPVPWFQTDEATDQVAFATAVEKLAKAGVRLSSKWVRDEIGAPEPKDDEEIVGDKPANDAEADPNADTEPKPDDGSDDGGDEEKPPAKAA